MTESNNLISTEMDHASWKRLVIQACKQHGYALTQREIAQLEEYCDKQQRMQYKETLDKIWKALIREIFIRASRGETFGSEERLRDEVLYGSVAELFPNSSPTFKRVLRSYTTFWREYLDIHSEENLLQFSLLYTLNVYKEAFHPGIDIRAAVPAALFEDKQRILLTQLGPEVDINDYFSNNPLLDRSGNLAKGSGCIVMLFALPALAGSVNVAFKVLCS